MLTIEESLELNLSYNTQRDFLIKFICYSTSVITIVDLSRGQVPEINLLQLIPGFYLFLLFLFFLFLLFFSNFFFSIPINLESKKNYGTKTVGKINYLISFLVSLFFFFFITILNFNTVIPISLDSFNTYGEKTLENLWSFNEVINLELILLIILSLVSQFPVILNFYFINEKDVNFFPQFWRFIILLIVIFSGFLTPTIDGYTQISFSFSGFSLYLILILFLKKRILIKFSGFSFFGF